MKQNQNKKKRIIQDEASNSKKLLSLTKLQNYHLWILATVENISNSTLNSMPDICSGELWNNVVMQVLEEYHCWDTSRSSTAMTPNIHLKDWWNWLKNMDR